MTLNDMSWWMNLIFAILIIHIIIHTSLLYDRVADAFVINAISPTGCNAVIKNHRFLSYDDDVSCIITSKSQRMIRYVSSNVDEEGKSTDNNNPDDQNDNDTINDHNKNKNLDISMKSLSSLDDDAIYDYNSDELMKHIITSMIPKTPYDTWEVMNTFDHFINQCTIQSFMFLLHSCHDIQTLRYIENFTQPVIIQNRHVRRGNNHINYHSQNISDDVSQNVESSSIGTTSPSSSNRNNNKLLQYHGLAAMNTTIYPTWESYFDRLLLQPKLSYIVESYQSYVPTYEMDIIPSSLCTRLMSIRQQIMNEWICDLRIISFMNNILNQTTDTTTTTTTTISMNNQNHINANGPSRQLLSQDEYVFLDSNEHGSEYNIMSSPLRKGNFDLLLLYITQVSIHRILNNNNHNDNKMSRTNSDNKIDNINTLTSYEQMILSKFYVNRIISHFMGQQPYRRATQFLQELLDYQHFDDNNNTIDHDHPTVLSDVTYRMVQCIILTRQQIAIEWEQYLTSNISTIHMNIQRKQLDVLMNSYGTTTTTNQVTTTSMKDDYTPYE